MHSLRGTREAPGRQERTIWIAWEAPRRQERTTWTACEAREAGKDQLDSPGGTREAGKDYSLGNYERAHQLKGRVVELRGRYERRVQTGSPIKRAGCRAPRRYERRK